MNVVQVGVAASLAVAAFALVQGAAAFSLPQQAAAGLAGPAEPATYPGWGIALGRGGIDIAETTDGQIVRVGR